VRAGISWELGLSVSGRKTLPNPDTHVFPLFEGTTLSEEDRGMLKRENIRFDKRLKKLKDPGDALKRKAHFGNGLSMLVGLASVGGNGGEGDKKPGGEKREKQRKEKEEAAELLDMGKELLKGNPVKNKKEMSARMREACAKGLLYKGEVVNLDKSQDEGGEERWDSTVSTLGLDGSDTGRRHDVSIGRLCKCSCLAYEKMRDDRTVGFTSWCKHIYAVLLRLLRVDRDAPVMTAMRFNKAESKILFSKVPNLRGLKG
jgi:hypothetical protein